jgi:heme A synthase
LSDAYLYVSRVGAGLMLGWTVLLFWAQLKPIERADVLLMTLLPVIGVLAMAAILAVRSNQMPLASMWPMFVFYAAALAMFIPAWLWARRQRGASKSE